MRYPLDEPEDGVYGFEQQRIPYLTKIERRAEKSLNQWATAFELERKTMQRRVELLLQSVVDPVGSRDHFDPFHSDMLLKRTEIDHLEWRIIHYTWSLALFP